MFDSMFAGIRASLKSAAQRSIDVAERNLDNPLRGPAAQGVVPGQVRREFPGDPPQPDGAGVYDRFGLDLPALSEMVKKH